MNKLKLYVKKVMFKERRWGLGINRFDIKKICNTYFKEVKDKMGYSRSR